MRKSSKRITSLKTIVTVINFWVLKFNSNIQSKDNPRNFNFSFSFKMLELLYTPEKKVTFFQNLVLEFTFYIEREDENKSDLFLLLEEYQFKFRTAFLLGK